MRLIAAAVLATALLIPSTAHATSSPAQATSSTAQAALTTAPPRKQAPSVNCAVVKCLALTFDDGPAKTTGPLLDILAKHRAKASFYLIGRSVARSPGLARRIAREGHEIGNHTYSHPRLTELPGEDIAHQLDRTQRLIAKATGRAPATMRPPYGATDDRVLSVAESLGLAQVMWTGTTEDWRLREERAIRRAVLSMARRNGVILMHDPVPATVEAMPSILAALKKRGYHLVTVSALLRGRPLSPGETYPPRK
ncbi:polysaccharide deacetylase family protein [Sinosporangium siamense]|uniref:Deacetylase n=1 Tax=Sinosporangium siamense TaxID=1367973 RepID=A0A919RBI4_9ACTN|nr:polysaccharide deacetylase family protein [Sinosporangium siamense]GII90853.1 deacetylase [Sinosporangium siamense]